MSGQACTRPFFGNIAPVFPRFFVALAFHDRYGSQDQLKSDRLLAGTLNPVELNWSEGFRGHELTKLRALVIEHRTIFLEKWHEHFADKD